MSNKLIIYFRTSAGNNKNKTNRKLKIRIEKIAPEAEAYARQMSQQNWTQFCNKLQGTLGTRSTWYPLRSLIGPGDCKAVATEQLRRLIRNYWGIDGQLEEEVGRT